MNKLRFVDLLEDQFYVTSFNKHSYIFQKKGSCRSINYINTDTKHFGISGDLVGAFDGKENYLPATQEQSDHLLQCIAASVYVVYKVSFKDNYLILN